MGAPGQVRVAVVDDDVWVRTGRTVALEGAGFDVALSCEHPEAMALGDGWKQIDVALVDAWDGREDWDRFPGVRVVEAIRAQRKASETLVIVISGHVLNDVLRLRMAEAGADFFYSHGDLRSPEDLVQAIRHPDELRRPAPPDPGSLAALGLSTSSRLNAAMHEIEDRGVTSAFTPGTSQKALPLGRRTLITVRRRLSEVGRLAAPNGQNSPDWRHLSRIINLARGADKDQEA